MGTILAMLGIYLSIGLKSFQQLNVVHDRLWAIVPTSIGMTVCDYTIVTWVVTTGAEPWQLLCLGLAAGTGSITGMKLHRRTRNAIRS